jgi:hypothetical protein
MAIAIYKKMREKLTKYQSSDFKSEGISFLMRENVKMKCEIPS